MARIRVPAEATGSDTRAIFLVDIFRGGTDASRSRVWGARRWGSESADRTGRPPADVNLVTESGHGTHVSSQDSDWDAGIVHHGETAARTRVAL
ncbi:hypothetical protein GCM10022402_42000 [Salinactinospora qingdaonensis]|uniref:Uncharacterized protein n=1 Tax=Salinactinospora qingdaonensis TaxID=702744 RepID=A0ABP7G993_9ACTN